MKKFTKGAVADAAGTTALNAVGFADLALRGRPASNVPARGLGALAGIATGLGGGTLAGQLRGAVRRLRPLAFGAVVYATLPQSQAAAAPKAPSAPASEESQAGGAARGPAGPAAPASRVLEHAAVLGAATGMRSTVALAALILRRSDGLPTVLRHPAARWIAATADGAELVVDKLPGTPSRLDPPGLTGRLISASLAAAILARSEHRGPIPSMLTASVTALAVAKICHDTRAALARHLPDPVVAMAEDALAIGLAAIGSGLTDSKLARQPSGLGGIAPGMPCLDLLS